MPLIDTFKAVAAKVANFINPQLTWEEISERLSDPPQFISRNLVSNLERVLDEPEYADRTPHLAARSCGSNHAILTIDWRGVVDLTTLRLDTEIADWQSKPDGTTYRGIGFRSSQQNPGCDLLQEAVMQCFHDLIEKNSHRRHELDSARDAYARDSIIFKNDRGALDSVFYPGR